MKHVKYRYQPRFLFDYQAVERWLNDQARHGWQLEKAGAVFWKFRRAEPANVTYAVTYLQDVSMFSPRPSGEQQDLDDLCTAAGWTRVTDWLQMQIFCSEAENPIPLETDETVRLTAIHRSMWKTIFPCHLLLLAVLLFFLRKIPYYLVWDPLMVLSNNGMLATSAGALVVVISMGLFFSGYYLWRRRSLKSIAQGGACASTALLRILGRASDIVLWLLILVMILTQFFSNRPESGVYILLYTLLFPLVSLSVDHTREALRDRGNTPGITILGTLLVDVALVVALIGGLTFLTRSDGWLARWLDDPASPAWTAPLSPDDLTDSAFFDCRKNGGASVLLSHFTCRYYAKDEGADFSYTLTASPYPQLQDWALNHYLRTPGESDSHILLLHIPGQDGVYYTMPGCRWDPLPAADWQAEQAWQLYDEEGAIPVYLLQYPDRISRLHLTVEPTAAQKALIHDRLLNTDLQTGGLLS